MCILLKSRYVIIEAQRKTLLDILDEKQKHNQTDRYRQTEGQMCFVIWPPKAKDK